MIKDQIVSFYDEFKQNGNILNQGEKETAEIFDEKRNTALTPLREMVANFLTNRITLKEFKGTSEKLCRTHPYWGFKGMSGQMQLNQFVNNIPDDNKEQILRDAISLPKTIDEAKQKIDALAKYIQHFKDIAENQRSIPRVSQISMLSYFWEIQDHQHWSAYYGSSATMLTNLGFYFDSAETPGNKYGMYMDAIKNIYSILQDMKLDLGDYPRWYIEHLLWYQYIQQDHVDLTKVMKDNVPQIKNETVTRPR